MAATVPKRLLADRVLIVAPVALKTAREENRPPRRGQGGRFSSAPLSVGKRIGSAL